MSQNDSPESVLPKANPAAPAPDAKIKKRMPEQDIAKGLVMLSVILVHSLSLFTVGGREIGASIGSVIVYSLMPGFAMPLFFVFSGYNYRYKGESFGKSLYKKVTQIIYPLLRYTAAIWIIMGIYLLCRGEMTVKHALNQFLGFWVTDPLAARLGLDAGKTGLGQLVGPAWFLKALFPGTILFLLIAPHIYDRLTSLFSVPVLLLAVSYLQYRLGVELPWFIESAPLVCALMLVGCLIKKLNFLNLQSSKRVWNIINVLVFFIFSFLIQYYHFRAGSFTAGEFYLGGGFAEVMFDVIYGILGAYAMVMIGRGLLRFPAVSRFLEWFGQRTLITLIIHGSIMRIFADIMGVTGSAPTFTYRNVVVFAATVITDSFALILIEKGRAAKENRKAALRIT